jgi:hypothetical protein
MKVNFVKSPLTGKAWVIIIVVIAVGSNHCKIKLNQFQTGCKSHHNHMSTAVRNVVRAISAFNGKHWFSTLRNPATPFAITFLFASIDNVVTLNTYQKFHTDTSSRLRGAHRWNITILWVIFYFFFVFCFFNQPPQAHAQPERRVAERWMIAQNACSDARTCLLGVSLNEIFAGIVIWLAS